MEEVLAARGVSYSYGAAAAVAGLDLTLRHGEVFGFVGPNGAGKTTTIKLLLGLLTPSAGSIRVFGRSLHENRTGVLRRIGALVETPSLYPHLTAVENLTIQRLAHGTPRQRIARVLELVSLHDARDRKVRQFSLGMRQRLGIAQALLHDPELLVLDEPANGLDPEGIQDLRALLRRLAADEGKTVFLSSHILAELEQVATKVAIISRGTLRFQGTIDALKGAQRARLTVTVDSGERAATVLAGLGHPVSSASADTVVVAAADREVGAAITAALVGGGVKLYAATYDRPNLEDAFLALLRADREDAP